MMKPWEFKPALSQFRVTILTAMALCLTNMGFILDGARNEWFQSFGVLMEYDRALILKGEIWRLLTCHLVHWSPEHFYLDVSVFLILGLAFEQKIGRIYGRVLLIAGSVISLTLLIFQNDLTAYRGISGLINTQIILGTGLYLFDAGIGRLTRSFYASVFSIHLLKTAYEAAFQVSFFSTEALGNLGNFTPLAHVTGVFVAFGYMIGAGFKTTLHACYQADL